jgi:hypothetical protein
LADDEKTIGALRLAVLSSLPSGHQRYLFKKVTNLCADWLRRQRISSSETSSSELASEIWLKLVSTLSPANNDSGIIRGAVGAADPRNDDRVLWLIAEIGGSQAIQHRFEDIRRERYGRGGRLKQPGEKPNEDEPGASTPQYGSPRHLQDLRDVWRGMLIVARQDFAGTDDLLLLLQLLADEPELLEESWGHQWPIQRIVELLSNRPPPRDWNQTLVDNAKRRLTGWIGRLMRKNGFDEVDLEALFAAVAKKGSKARDTHERLPSATTG